LVQGFGLLSLQPGEAVFEQQPSAPTEQRRPETKQRHRTEARLGNAKAKKRPTKQAFAMGRCHRHASF
jgi:hypothetical protein